MVTGKKEPESRRRIVRPAPKVNVSVTLMTLPPTPMLSRSTSVSSVTPLNVLVEPDASSTLPVPTPCTEVPDRVRPLKVVGDVVDSMPPFNRI